jgi:DNA-binding NarL/FixJ family response regulator
VIDAAIIPVQGCDALGTIGSMSDPALGVTAETAAAETADPAAVPRLLVVDADDRTRESIVGLLRIRHRFDVIGSAGHTAAAVALLREHRPDVVIVDPRLPELPDGIALIRRIRAIAPSARILALGWSPGLEQDTRAAGADGFLRKTFKPAELTVAIERCIDGVTADPSDQPTAEPAAGLIL